MSDKNLRFLLFGEDRTAGKTFSKAAEDANSATGRIGASFSKLGGVVGGEVGELLSKAGEGFDKLSEEHGKIGDKMMATGGIIAGIGVAAQQFASKDQAAHQQLQAAIDATGKSYDGLDGQIEDAVKTQEKYGHKATDTQEALRVMTQAFQDPQKALENMNLVENLAAAKHVSLADAATMVAKAHGGSARVFKEFGIAVGKNKDGTKDYDGALQTLSDRLNGQASAASDTFAGKVAGVRAHVEDVGASLAEKLGPALTTAGPAIMGVGAVMESGLVPALGKAGLGMLKMAGQAIIWGAQMLVAGAEAMLPFLPIILIVAAVGVAAYELYKHWDVVWAGIKSVAEAVGNWFAVTVPAWFEAGWHAVTDFFHAAWVRIQNVLGMIWDGIKEVFSWTPLGFVVEHFGQIVDFVRTLPGKIGSAAAGMWDGIKDGFRGILNWIIDKWNGFHLTLGGGTFMGVTIPQMTLSMPQIPRFETGTNNFAGGVAQVGENGVELVHLPAGSRITPHPQAVSMLKGGQNGGPMIHIDNYNEAHNPPQMVAAEFAFMVRSL